MAQNPAVSKGRHNLARIAKEGAWHSAEERPGLKAMGYNSEVH